MAKAFILYCAPRRSRVSNDNPYSESLFKTAKFAPTFPECFAGIEHGRAFVEPFVATTTINIDIPASDS